MCCHNCSVALVGGRRRVRGCGARGPMCQSRLIYTNAQTHVVAAPLRLKTLAGLSWALLWSCSMRGCDLIYFGVDVMVTPHEGWCDVTAPLRHIHCRCVAMIWCCIWHGRDGRSKMRDRIAELGALSANPSARRHVSWGRVLRLICAIACG